MRTATLLLAPVLGLLAVFCPAATRAGDVAWSGTTVNDLHAEYRNIFKKGNRNAASHLWASFLLARSENFATPAALQNMFHGFCPVSGSPVRPSAFNRYQIQLGGVNGGAVQGYMHFCCWPCVCDSLDYLWADTKTVQLKDGKAHTFEFVVIGNPCTDADKLDEPFTTFGREETIAGAAPELACSDDGKLQGATLSDNGYVIIGIVGDPLRTASPVADSHPDAEAGQLVSAEDGDQHQVASSYKSHCKSRADAGYNSGMGQIFRMVADIDPVTCANGDVATSNSTAMGRFCSVSSTSSSNTADAEDSTSSAPSPALVPTGSVPPVTPNASAEVYGSATGAETGGAPASFDSAAMRADNAGEQSSLAGHAVPGRVLAGGGIVLAALASMR